MPPLRDLRASTGTSNELETRLLVSLLVLLVVGSSLSPLGAQQTSSPDLLDLGSGAALVHSSSEYSSDWKAQWSALALLDGTTRFGWCSGTGAPFPHEFVIELSAVHRMESVTIDNSGNQESSQPGISARLVEVQTSISGPNEGFRRVARGEIAQGDSTTLHLEAVQEVRWLKIVIHSNWGHDRYTEIMELAARGAPAGSSQPGTDITGVYEGVYEGRTLRTVLERNGSQITGCYSGAGDGRLSGHFAGRSAELEWRQDRDGGSGFNGSLLLAVSDAGSLSGLWYGRGENAHLVGRWTGHKIKAEAEIDCPPNDLASALDQTGQATLYGIRFESDSAKLTAEAEPILQQVQSLLDQRKKIRLRIEGHTDGVASEAYNQDLSQRRAAAVRTWLVEKGVASNRLDAEGKGESEPVADNSTTQGRRLNRRVEIVKVSALRSSS